jgi:hypothetical protein
VADEPQRPHIGARVDPLTCRLLGRHVARRADDRTVGRHRRRVAHARLARQPEVDDHRAAITRDDDVLRLEVAVHHARCMDRRCARNDLREQVARDGRRHAARDLRTQALALDQLHRHEPQRVGLAEIVYPGRRCGSRSGAPSRPRAASARRHRRS